MSTATLPSSHPGRPGRLLLWLSAILSLGALVAYLVQLLYFHRLTVPWYLAWLGGAALFAAIVSVIRSPSILRGLIALPFALLAGAEIWIVTSGSALPTYDGPLLAGTAFPTFSAKRATGAIFSDAELRGRPTVLTFFRGRW